MQGARAQPSGRGGRGAFTQGAFLLWLCILPLHAQVTQPAPSLSDVCGKTKFQGKIFGGQAAGPERWPWQASLLLRGRHICGAVLIDKDWVASAAHCFQRSQYPGDYRILLGYNRLHNPTNYSRQMSVNRLIIHADYDKFHRQGSDIVLMQLHTPVKYNSHVLPACVPESTMKVPLDRPCWISGWGMITENRFLPQPFQLQEAEVILMDNKHCARFFIPPPGSSGDRYVVKEDMVCAGEYIKGRSICRGDSGGPLVCPMNGSWYVVGLSSWSSACEPPISSPSVFTRVSYFANWIKEKKQTSPEPDPSLVPPEEKPPALVGWNSRGSVLRPGICTALLSSQILLWHLVLLRSM